MNSDKRWCRMTWGAAIALAIGTTYWHPAAADDVAPIAVVTPGSTDHPTTETALGGTVILRGSGWPKPVATRTAPERTPINYPAAVPPAAPPGVDRNYDTSGFNENFDRRGLTQPQD